MLQDRMFALGGLLDAAVAPVPDVGVGRVLPDPNGPDVVPIRSWTLKKRSASLGVRRRPALCVDRYHLAARSRRASRGLLHRVGHLLGAAVPTGRAIRAYASTSARHADRRVHELLGRRARRDRRQPRCRSTGTSCAADRRARLPAVSWIVPSSGVSDHPAAPGTIRTSMAYVTTLINAAMRGPGLGLDGDLPDLGRLGWVLRPRAADRASTRTATACACPAS